MHTEINKYAFFHYEANEALHLSPSEEQTIWDLYYKIEAEYHNDGLLITQGLPSVNAMASQLNLSSRYVSDMLKQETCKTAMELDPYLPGN